MDISTIYLICMFIFIVGGTYAFNLYKKKKGEHSKAPDILVIVGLIVALALGTAPVFMDGIQEWDRGTTILWAACLLVIGRILRGWRKNKKE